MQLNITQTGADAIVSVQSSRLDASFVPQFKSELLELIQKGGKNIVIDLSLVKLVDSSGLGSLVSLLKALGGQGGISIRGASPSVLALFKLTRMDRVFSIEPAVAERPPGGITT